MILFGTAGAPHSAKKKGAPEAAREIARLGLDCMEIEFVHGVRMKDEKAEALGEAAREAGVVLTCHAPYYINLCSKEEEKEQASIQRILDSARKTHIFFGKSVTFHPAFYQGRDPEEIYAWVARSLKAIREELVAEGVAVDLAPELTGKATQFGSLEELIRLCQEVEGIRMCVDFSHMAARSVGEINDYDGFVKGIEAIREGLGDVALEDLRMHASGIEWTGKGERKHHPFEESDFAWKDLVKALVDCKVSGTLICESPSLEVDALKMKSLYNELSGN